MGRSRMVDDGFWGDPDLADLTIDERCTLLLFLTCPQSNVIGVYRLIWRQVGAGSGWTHDQILNASKNLKSKGCIDLEESSGWVWVKEWWKHNSIKGAFTGNVAKKARQELLQVPDSWKSGILDWIENNDFEGACEPLISSLRGAGGNSTTSYISIPTTTTTGSGSSEDLVEAALAQRDQAEEVPPDVTPAPKAPSGSSAFETLVIEPVLSALKPQVINVLTQSNISDPATVQDLVDELAGRIEAGQRGDKPKVGSPLDLLRTYLSRNQEGRFDRIHCLSIQTRRLRLTQEAERRNQPHKRSPMPEFANEALNQFRGGA